MKTFKVRLHPKVAEEFKIIGIPVIDTMLMVAPDEKILSPKEKNLYKVAVEMEIPEDKFDVNMLKDPRFLIEEAKEPKSNRDKSKEK